MTRMLLRSLGASAIVLVLATATCNAQVPTVSVWSRVSFGEDGKVRKYALVDEDLYETAFADKVKAAIAQASVRPPVVDGKAVAMETGMELRYELTSGAKGLGARLLGITMGPTPPRSRFDPEALEKILNEWTGEVTATCNVGLDGKCRAVEVTGVPLPPEALRRYLRATLERWQFTPQTIDGQAVEGEYRNTFTVEVQERRPEDFRQEKFDRLNRRR